MAKTGRFLRSKEICSVLHKLTIKGRKSYGVSLTHAEKVFDKTTFSVKYSYKQGNLLKLKGGSTENYAFSFL